MDASKADIFGTGGGGLDVSDEALADKWEENTSIGDGGVDEAPAVEEEEVPPVEAAPVAAAEVVEEQPNVEKVEKPEGEDDAFVIPENLASLTPEELAKQVVDSQQMVGRQATEVGEMRRQMAELERAQQAQQQQFELQLQQYAVAMMQQQQAAAIDPESLTYGQAIDLLDQGLVGPEAVDAIISAAWDAAEDGDPNAAKAARAMERDFMYRIARAETMAATQQQVAQVEQKFEPVQRDLQERSLREAVIGLYTAEPEDAQEFGSDVVQIMQKPNAANPIEVQLAKQFEQDPASALKAGLTYVRGLHPVRSKAYKDAMATAKASAQVETGASPQAAEAPLTEEQRVKATIFGDGQKDRLAVLGF